jgi:threonine/homoserine/homoserine lactone efflux protein
LRFPSRSDKSHDTKGEILIPLSLFFQTYGIGFVAAATLGPIALVVIQRTLKQGWRVGVASGVGVALADGLFGLAGALGLAALTSLVIENQLWIRLVGGGILIYIGAKAFFIAKQPEALPEEGIAPSSSSLAGAAGSIFLLTLTNPMTIMFFSAVYAGLVMGDAVPAKLGWVGLVSFSVGVFAGSFTWWVLLSSLVSAARQRFQLDKIAWLNRASGLLIAGFGLWVWMQLFTSN